MDFFYRQRQWYAGQFVRKVVFKGSLPNGSISFFTTVLNALKPKLLSVLVRDVNKTFLDSYIQLPTRDGAIDFMFMERFVAELKAYLAVTGLSDYTLTPEEQQAIQDFQEGNLQWHDYRLGDLFEIRPTKSYKYTNRDLFSFEGDTPVVTNTSLNNGISGTVGLPPTEEGGIITYSDTTTSEAIFYQDKPFVGYSHIQGLYPRVYKDIWVESTLLYVVVAFRKVAHNKFDYGNKFNRNIASNMYIQLPTSSDKLDYTQMETFIRAIEKLVIRDVVLYADRELAATEQVINQ